MHIILSENVLITAEMKYIKGPVIFSLFIHTTCTMTLRFLLLETESVPQVLKSRLCQRTAFIEHTVVGNDGVPLSKRWLQSVCFCLQFCAHYYHDNIFRLTCWKRRHSGIDSNHPFILNKTSQPNTRHMLESRSAPPPWNLAGPTCDQSIVCCRSLWWCGYVLVCPCNTNNNFLPSASLNHYINLSHVITVSLLPL